MLKERKVLKKAEIPKEQVKPIKYHGMILGMPDKIPTVEDMALLRSFEPKG